MVLTLSYFDSTHTIFDSLVPNNRLHKNFSLFTMKSLPYQPSHPKDDSESGGVLRLGVCSIIVL